jgi:hypothetical protein
MGQKGADLWCGHGGWMAFVVGQDKTFDPVDVGLFSANAIVFKADFVANEVKEFRLVVHGIAAV